MRLALFLCALALGGAARAHAQRPDTTARRDTVPKTAADSAAADSAFLERELRRAGADTARPTPTGPTQAQGTGGPTNPRFLPDISAIAEVVGDFTPDGTTQESGRRIDIRELELAIASAVDPFFRLDGILGISDEEGVAIEEAYLTATALPYGLQGRLGRFHMPIGKQNTTHRAELQTIEYPYVIQRFLGPEAAKGTGASLSQIFAPFGFYQELQVTVVDQFGADEEGGLTASTVANKRLSGLGYSARFRNYVDLSQSTNLEVSGSAATGRRAQPLDCGAAGCPEVDGVTGVNAVNARQSLVGVDVTYRWRPLQQGLYKSLILQAEAMRQINQRRPDVDVPDATYVGPERNFGGAYVFARYQLSRRGHVGTRYDWVQDPQADGGTLQAVSGYLQFFPTEFSKFVLGYERTMPPNGGKALNRILFQATAAVGPHRPHPF